jgi:hypothetical protein
MRVVIGVCLMSRMKCCGRGLRPEVVCVLKKLLSGKRVEVRVLIWVEVGRGGWGVFVDRYRSSLTMVNF